MEIGLLPFPVIVGGLLLTLFRKAGLPMAWSITALSPLLAAALPEVLLSLAEQGKFDLSHPIYAYVPLAAALLTLFPIALLAFLRWPSTVNKSTARR